MRKSAAGAVFTTLFVLGACHRDQVKKYDAPAARTPVSQEVGVDVTLDGATVLKKGVLIVPLKVSNLRKQFVQVFYDRCEVETTTGERRGRFKGKGETTNIVGPGSSKTFKLVFGEVNQPLPGDTFRIYLWIAPTDGSGLIEGVPVVTLGAGAFKDPARPFVRGGASGPPPADALPHSTEPPPPVPADAGGPAADPKPIRSQAACPNCGELRPSTGNCPGCGLP